MSSPQPDLGFGFLAVAWWWRWCYLGILAGSGKRGAEKRRTSAVALLTPVVRRRRARYNHRISTWFVAGETKCCGALCAAWRSFFGGGGGAGMILFRRKRCFYVCVFDAGGNVLRLIGTFPFSYLRTYSAVLFLLRGHGEL